jgi:hypothetical protein
MQTSKDAMGGGCIMMAVPAYALMAPCWLRSVSLLGLLPSNSLMNAHMQLQSRRSPLQKYLYFNSFLGDA